MGKRSVARRQPGLGSSMTAVPHTAAIRASTCRRAQQRLRGSQGEYAWQHPPTALAAKQPFVMHRCSSALGTKRTLVAVLSSARDSAGSERSLPSAVFMQSEMAPSYPYAACPGSPPTSASSRAGRAGAPCGCRRGRSRRSRRGPIDARSSPPVHLALHP
jgi:hypothetical protein